MCISGLEDAVQLVERISSAEKTAEGLHRAVQGYEQEMIERGRRDVDISTSSAVMLLDYEQVVSLPSLGAIVDCRQLIPRKLQSPQAKLGLKKAQASDVEPVDTAASTAI